MLYYIFASLVFGPASHQNKYFRHYFPYLQKNESSGGSEGSQNCEGEISSSFRGMFSEFSCVFGLVYITEIKFEWTCWRKEKGQGYKLA